MGRLLTLSEITLSSPKGHPVSFVHSSVGRMQKQNCGWPDSGRYWMTSYNHGTFTQQALGEGNKITAWKKNKNKINQLIDIHRESKNAVKMWLVRNILKTIAAPLLQWQRKQSPMNLRLKPTTLGLNNCWSMPGEKALFLRGKAGPLINKFSYRAHANPLLQMEWNGLFLLLFFTRHAFSGGSPSTN